MVVAPILKALRAEAGRLAAAGTVRLSLCSRKAKKHVTISARMDRAILDELRVKAAIAVLSGANRIELSETLDGQEFHGRTIHVDPEQYADVSIEAPQIRPIPTPSFGSSA